MSAHTQHVMRLPDSQAQLLGAVFPRRPSGALRCPSDDQLVHPWEDRVAV